MTTTARLELPLLQAAQAQKHVTVNEALSLLDSTCQLVLSERERTVAPDAPADGAAYGVGSGASGSWLGQDGRVALAVNGGWAFVTPGAGWRAWDISSGALAVHDGTGWIAGAVAISAHGAATVAEVVETEVELVGGSRVDSDPVIPAGCVVQAVTARVVAAISGAPSWQMGVPGSANRYGTSYGAGVGSWARGVTGQPQAYYSDTALQITAESGAFTGGRIRLAVHLSRYTIPRE